ncbi:MAG: hypothetical protein ACI9W6_001532, partial [Motiliproteus sp.]
LVNRFLGKVTGRTLNALNDFLKRKSCCSLLSGLL